MLRVLHKSTDPCFVCKAKEKVVQVKGDSFSLPLCMTHAYEHVPDAAKPTKKPAAKPGGGS